MRVLVLGAGYAGVTLARRLETLLPPAATVTLVNDTPYHLVQHEVHRVIRRPTLTDVIQVPLEDIVDAEVVVGRVTDVDRDGRVVTLDDGQTLEYDYAAVCLGAETAYYGLPGVEAHATPLKRVADAETIREEFLHVCDASGTAVVGGAGLSGIQVAGELAALADEEGAAVDIVLLEQFDDVAPNFPPNFQRATRKALEARGVDVRTNTTVERATEHELELDSGALAYDQFVWTGGIAGGESMDGDRPVVRSDLRLDAHTFVVGDAAKVVDADGEAVPASASAAIREARRAATNVARLVGHDLDDEAGFAPHLDPFRFEVPGWIVSVGDGAVAQVGPKVLTGPAANAMKATVGAGHLSSVGAITQAVELVEAELGP